MPIHRNCRKTMLSRSIPSNARLSISTIRSNFGMASGRSFAFFHLFDLKCWLKVLVRTINFSCLCPITNQNLIMENQQPKQPLIGKFIDPLTDWGFRRLFGQEPNKEILVEFLNDLFQGEKHIIDLTYAPNEYDGDDVTDKRVIFDLHCRGDNGEY